MIAIPRFVIVGLAAVFSGYHLLLALYSLHTARDMTPYLAAMVLYALATTVSLWPAKHLRMPLWMAVSNVVVCIAIPLLVANQLDLNGTVGSDYSTWYPAAIGTLMVITSTRKQHLLAWVGVLALAVHTAFWAGIGGLATLGVVGSLMWVAVAHITSRSLVRIEREARQYVEAEREATLWQAAQDAHLFERQFRLRRTSRIALPMLRQIVAQNGDLSAAERQECTFLEATIRDEIRGRKLLNDRVRDQVMKARRRGSIVTLLDEGGLDDLSEADAERVQNQLADAIAASRADRVIARTVAESSDTAVTVVGLNLKYDQDHGALGQHDSGRAELGHDDEQVELWLEIPR